jgi:putative membrane protein
MDVLDLVTSLYEEIGIDVPERDTRKSPASTGSWPTSPRPARKGHAVSASPHRHRLGVACLEPPQLGDVGCMWLRGGLMMVLWVALVVGAVWLVASASGGVPAAPTDLAGEILAERYARSEISTEECHERLDSVRRPETVLPDLGTGRFRLAAVRLRGAGVPGR